MEPTWQSADVGTGFAPSSETFTSLMLSPTNAPPIDNSTYISAGSGAGMSSAATLAPVVERDVPLTAYLTAVAGIGTERSSRRAASAERSRRWQAAVGSSATPGVSTWALKTTLSPAGFVLSFTVSFVTKSGETGEKTGRI